MDTNHFFVNEELSKINFSCTVSLDKKCELSTFDIESSIRRCLPERIDRSNILILAPDFTRHSFVFEEALLRIMQEMYGEDRVDIAIASGMHRQSSLHEIRMKFGLNVDKCVIYQNNPVAGCSWLAKLKEEKDYFIFGLSNPYPHTYMGMSGGYKLVLPGMASVREAGEFHSLGMPLAKEMQKTYVDGFIDYWIGCAHSYLSWPIDLCFTESKYYFDTWVQRVRDYYKVTIPNELPDIAVLEPCVKNTDFIQAMNSLLVCKQKHIVRSGGLIVIACSFEDGMGVHYLFQRGNGVHRRIMYDEVFENELCGRKIAFLTDSVPERAMQEFFKKRITVFDSVDRLAEYAWHTYGDDVDIHHYIAPEIMIGE